MTEAKAWIRAAHCRDIPLREGRAVNVGQREIAIFNLGDRFVAIENQCPHKGGPLADGIVSGNSVVCPLHAWKLCLDTGMGLSGASASNCVQTFRTRVEEGVVLVALTANPPTADDTGREDLPLICLEHRGSPDVREPSASAS